MPTITTIAEKTATQLGEEYGDLDVKTTFDDWTIEVVQDVLLKETWAFSNVLSSFTTSASGDNYSLTAAGGEIKTLYRTDVDLFLTYVPLEQLRASQVDYDSEGPPRYWAINGISAGTFTVKLWPVPDTSYEILVYGSDQINIDTISVTSSIPLPSPMIPLVQTGVRQLFYEHTYEDNAAAREAIKFAQKLNDAKARYLINRSARLHFGYSDVPDHEDSMGRPVMPTNIPVTPIT
jgi:hypothetical protein